MKKTLLVIAMAITLALSTMAPVMGENHQGVDITSPAAQEIFILDETIDLNASITGESKQVYWAVRTDCRDSGTTVAGNVDGYETQYTFNEGMLQASIEASELDAGEFCFTITVDFDDGTRDSKNDVLFYVVDEYAKVGGTIRMGDEGRGNSPTHAFDGFVGNADGKIVGEVSINYRELGQTCTFSPGGLAFRDAPAIGLEDVIARADLGGGTSLGGDDWSNSCGGTAHIILLDRDAGAEADPSYPRGAIVVDASEEDYSIEDFPTPRWVGLEHGNIHVASSN